MVGGVIGSVPEWVDPAGAVSRPDPFAQGWVVVPPWAAQSLALSALKPWPLQLFWPLQAWS
jgi:hypothetical protein